MFKTKTKLLIKFIFGTFLGFSVLINFSYVQAAFSSGTIVSSTNSARAQNGLGALSTNSALASAAYAKAQDILANDYFAHNSPDGKTPWDFINQSGYTYAYAGENLAIGYSDASELFSAWMASATHRDNILNPNFREIGVAVVSGEYQGAETIVTVQEFGATAESAAATSPEQVASETAGTTESTPSSESSPEAGNIPKTFEFVKDKTEFSPKSIFAGEEGTFKVTFSGEVKTLEAEAFDQKFNLLESSTVTGTKEKTYTLKQKIETDGKDEVKIVAKDKNGKSETLSLGTLEVKKKVIAKNETQQKTGLIAGFKENFTQNWPIYAIVLAAIALAFGSYILMKRNRFKLLPSWRF